MNNQLPSDLYHSSISNSPPSHQTRSLHRQNSRHFDGALSHRQNGMYPFDDPSSRYDTQRYNDRVSPTLQNNFGGYDMGMQQTWNSSAYGHNNTLAALGATTRVKPGASGRSPLPQMWLDQQPMGPPGGMPSYGSNPMGGPHMRQEPMGNETDEDLIPTAIVIKNIPFAVKKEQLVQVMTEMALPLPYAFNYHFDNGVFRGLAFANFQTAHETAAVIQAMNHLELHGRKLRVEYKKMLPQAERDRIEREKRERRGQLEEQHRPMGNAQLQNQNSMSSLNSHVPATSPSPVSSRGNHPALDMNDPTILNYYSKLLLFQGDPNQEILSFPPTIPPTHRKIVHGLAHQLGLGHRSHGTDDQRQIIVYRSPQAAGGISPPMSSSVHLDANRRQLSRAATTDFSDVRNANPSLYGGGFGTQSTGYLGFTDSQGGLSAGSNLRAAKSHADLRSWTPSPAQSAASFPAGLTGNLSRFTEYTQGSPGSSRTNLTPTGTNMPGGNDALLVNGMNSMNLGSGLGNGGSPHRLRGMVSWERDGGSTAPGPIGGHRTYSANHDDQSRARNQAAPLRQPRGPIPDRGNGFPQIRQGGHRSRNSDELSSPTGTGVEILVE